MFPPNKLSTFMSFNSFLEVRDQLCQPNQIDRQMTECRRLIYAVLHVWERSKQRLEGVKSPVGNRGGWGRSNFIFVCN
jgi:hypothetical protein